MILTSDNLHLSHTLRIPQHDTDLRRSRALLRGLADLVDDLVGGDLEP